MNIIKFKKISIRNFLTIGDSPVVIDFDDYFTGLYQVIGLNYDNLSESGDPTSNGVGKSCALVNSILVGLYGKAINNINNKYIANRTMDSKDTGYIEIELTKNDTDNYIIFCEIKISKKRDYCGLTYTITKNGQPITLSSKAETLAYIQNDIIGCDYEIFKNTMVISSSNITNFFTMPKNVKNKYLEGIFNLNTLGMAYDMVSKKTNEVKKSLKLMSDNYAVILGQLNKLKTQNDNWVQQKQSDIEQIKKQIDELRNSSKLDIEIIVPDHLDEKRNAISKHDQLLSKLTELQQQLNKINKKISTIKSDIRVANTLLEKHKEVLDNVCDDCNKNIQSLFKLDEANELIKTSNEELEIQNSNKDKLEQSYEKLTKMISKIQVAKDEINQYELSLQKKQSAEKQFKDKLHIYEEQLNKTTESENPFDELIRTTKEKEQETKNELEAVSTKQQYMNAAKYIFSDEGVKQFIISDIIDALNKRILYYLNKMGSDYTVYFDKNLVYEFVTPTGPCEYASFSAGERKRLDLAVLFAFRDILTFNAVKTNILVIDEILDSAIDTYCLQSVVQILHEKSLTGQQSVFVISHRESLSQTPTGTFNKLMKIIKRDGIITHELEAI